MNRGTGLLEYAPAIREEKNPLMEKHGRSVYSGSQLTTNCSNYRMELSYIFAWFNLTGDFLFGQAGYKICTVFPVERPICRMFVINSS